MMLDHIEKSLVSLTVNWFFIVNAAIVGTSLTSIDLTGVADLLHGGIGVERTASRDEPHTPVRRDSEATRSDTILTTLLSGKMMDHRLDGMTRTTSGSLSLHTPTGT